MAKDWMVLITLDCDVEPFDAEWNDASVREKRIRIEKKSQVRRAVRDHWHLDGKLTFRWLSRVDDDCKLIYQDGELVGEYHVIFCG